MTITEHFYDRAAKLTAEGLYDSVNEHDACGVGFVANINGKPTRAIVEAGITALKAVFHRGAVDADGKTGDGAGIHIEIPHDFFQEQITHSGRGLLSDSLAVGMMFLPKKNFAAQETCRSIVEAEILKFGYRLYGWRQVPVHAELIGEIAGDSRPEIEQILIAGNDKEDARQFELHCYFIRKRIEKAVRAKAINDFYICSLSSRSIIYKGLFKAEQLTAFYPDLLDPRFISSFAIFHQRFSTNTAPAWHLAQPFRMIAHNGEINTLKGNIHFMRSHEATMSCPRYEGYLEDVIPVIPDNTSDTGALDAVFEVLTRAGHPLPLSKLVLIPPAWAQTPDVPMAHKEMYSFLNSLSEQWDGPAAIAATDGEWIIGGMDRNGLRPLRYTITRDGMIIAASESGMVDVADSDIVERGRLGPGDILGIHLPTGKLYRDRELKDYLAAQYPYGEWVAKSVRLKDIMGSEQDAKLRKIAGVHPALCSLPPEKLRALQLASGTTHEDIETILHPMAAEGKEAVGSMGDDTPLAVLSDKYRGFHHFFRQNFSQVTNPPIDSLRERRVMSLTTRFGNDGNYLALDASHSHILVMDTPILLAHELSAIKTHFAERIVEIDTLFVAHDEKNALRKGIDRVIFEAEEAIRKGKNYILLTDERMDAEHIAIPMILAISALQSHLVERKLRKRTSILVRTSECFEVHSAAVMIGCGATVINPYVAEATLLERAERGVLQSGEAAMENFREALGQGLLKIMSKMGISVISAYRGGMNFEAIGLSRALVSEFFPGLPSRISGIGLAGIEARSRATHALGFGNMTHNTSAGKQTFNPLPLGGFYRSRAREEQHAWEGKLTHLLQNAVGKGSFQMFKQYSQAVHALPAIHIRDLLDFRSPNTEIPIDEVESITEIRKRFIAPAMSLGALSPEAHMILAIAMNKIGAASNSGEGGEGAERYKPLENGDNANSTIKQIASGRFGVTAEYLNSASELQIKVAQGAKPGEGGQLPGFKVTVEIARLRHATAGVTLISPPPHHDIYSIEDLAQLIYDLKQINPKALVSVKLVAQSGIGTIASGVAKAMADKIVIAGHSGGTGASAWSSIKHAGIPWEMGLAETNQVLTLNRMRHRVKLQTDGGLKTGRDIVMAAMLGAEEYALGTASLVAMGCILVRQCHMNTCPVGITTQDPALRAKFEGTVDKVVNLFSFVAEEVREILASLGFSSLNQVIGRTDLLAQVSRGANEYADIDLNNILAQADSGGHERYCTLTSRNEVPDTLDSQMLKDAADSLVRGEKIQLAYSVKNTMRTIGARFSSELVQKYADTHFYDDHITLRLRGSAGQSLGAFATKGLRIELLGDANDYVGKGLSGATIIIRPRPSSALVPHENTIIGNTVLYGATSGKLFASGQAGERFAVRNSGAEAVIEGCGSNGCEYMTGGVVVILGGVGYNFAAGMTGGMAFVYDVHHEMESHINADTVLYQRVESSYWEGVLKKLIEEHSRETSSPITAGLLAGWQHALPNFYQICPKEMVERLAHPLREKIVTTMRA